MTTCEGAEYTRSPWTLFPVGSIVPQSSPPRSDADPADLSAAAARAASSSGPPPPDAIPAAPAIEEDHGSTSEIEAALIDALMTEALEEEHATTTALFAVNPDGVGHITDPGLHAVSSRLLSVAPHADDGRPGANRAKLQLSSRVHRGPTMAHDCVAVGGENPSGSAFGFRHP